LHRVRDQLVGERTALMNQVRAILLERGHVVAQGRAKLAACLTALLDTEADSTLTLRMRTLVAEVRERWQDLDRRIAALDAEFAEQARTDENARRLTTIPGIGVLDATAWWPPSATWRLSPAGATGQPGSASYRGR
jgi:transposase